jgi:hypothetical protein
LNPKVHREDTYTLVPTSVSCGAFHLYSLNRELREKFWEDLFREAKKRLINQRPPSILDNIFRSDLLVQDPEVARFQFFDSKFNVPELTSQFTRISPYSRRASEKSDAQFLDKLRRVFLEAICEREKIAGKNIVEVHLVPGIEGVYTCENLN